MKLCAIQIPFAYNEADAEKSVDFLISQLDSCTADCDVILTPEYSNAPAAFEKGRCIPFALSHTEKLLASARNAAKRCSAIVAVNCVWEAEKGVFRNTTLVFDSQGELAGHFFKQHLPRSEKNINLLDEEYTRSYRDAEIVEVDGIRLGCLICYDTYFGEYVAKLAHQHPDLVLVSSFQRAERQEIIRMQNQHLAYSCNSFVLRSSVSMGENASSGGNSLVAVPEGTIACEFGNKLGILSCEVGDLKHKYMRSNSFGGALIPNDQFVEQARATWAYRPAGSMTIEPENRLGYPRICAHRGFNTVAPESSMAAFGSAIALGAAEIEFDVRFSSDGVPVVVHDNKLDRVSNGTGIVEEKTFAELRKLDFGAYFSKEFAGLKILTLNEVLEKFARHAIINLHVKTDEKCASEYPAEQMKKIVELLYRYDQQDHVYFMGCPEVMKSAMQYAPEIPRCMGAFPGPWEIVERAVEFKCKKVQFFTEYFNQDMIDSAHANGLICNYFFCDDPVRTKELLAMGIDTVLTNNFLAVNLAKQEYCSPKASC